MKTYYQKEDHHRSEWLPVEQKVWKKVRKEAAYHFGIYFMSETPNPELNNLDKVRYRGDLWFDIDHKPQEGETQEDALQRSITDLHSLRAYLHSAGVQDSHIQVFASGSKGFHLVVPGKIFGSSNPIKDLPRIHRFMVEDIIREANLKGVDTSLYCMGKGKMLRVENKQRQNGKYKVLLTPTEVAHMTPAMYDTCVSDPRGDTPNLDPGEDRSEALMKLFESCKARVQAVNLDNATVISQEMMDSLEGEIPRCVELIVTAQSINPVDGAFNGAKMSLARYLGTSGLSENQQNQLIDQFATNWNSSKNPTKADRVQATKSALSFGKENGFSCKLMKRVLTVDPCNGCPIREQEIAQLESNTSLLETDSGYFKTGQNGSLIQITNFTITPVLKQEGDLESPDFSPDQFVMYEYAVKCDGKVLSKNLSLQSKAWISTREFKTEIQNWNKLTYIGTDNDLQNLKAFVMSDEKLAGIPMIKQHKRIGFHYHVDPDRDIKELVWVQPGFSINASGVKDTVRYSGNTCSKLPCLRIQEFNVLKDGKFNPEDFNQPESLEELKILYKMQPAGVMSVMFGWSCATWLWEHLRQANLQHSPILSLWGLAGAGKTSLAGLVAHLGGADYTNNEVYSLDGATPFPFKEELSKYSTLPRVVDELNKPKLRYSIYRAIIGVVKAAATGNALPQGMLGKRGARVDDRVITAPVIILGTEENRESEIQDRAISLMIDKRYRPLTKEEWLFVTNHAVALAPFAEAMFYKALHTSPEQAHEWYRESLLRLPPAFEANRTAINWAFIGVGLKFLREALQDTPAPDEWHEIAESIEEDFWSHVGEVAVDKVTQSIVNEVDKVLMTLSELTHINQNNGLPYLSEGSNYLVQGDYLHLHSFSAFAIYKKYMRDQSDHTLIGDREQFKSLLEQQHYYVGVGLVPSQFNLQDWIALNIPKLEEGGIHVGRFIHTPGTF